MNHTRPLRIVNARWSMTNPNRVVLPDWRGTAMSHAWYTNRPSSSTSSATSATYCCQPMSGTPKKRGHVATAGPNVSRSGLRRVAHAGLGQLR